MKYYCYLAPWLSSRRLSECIFLQFHPIHIPLIDWKCQSQNKRWAISGLMTDYLHNVYPQQKPSFLHKLVWTIITLVVFAICCQVEAVSITPHLWTSPPCPIVDPSIWYQVSWLQCFKLYQRDSGTKQRHYHGAGLHQYCTDLCTNPGITSSKSSSVPLPVVHTATFGNQMHRATQAKSSCH